MTAHEPRGRRCENCGHAREFEGYATVPTREEFFASECARASCLGDGLEADKGEYR